MHSIEGNTFFMIQIIIPATYKVELNKKKPSKFTKLRDLCFNLAISFLLQTIEYKCLLLRITLDNSQLHSSVLGKILAKFSIISKLNKPELEIKFVFYSKNNSKKNNLAKILDRLKSILIKSAIRYHLYSLE